MSLHGTIATKKAGFIRPTSSMLRTTTILNYKGFRGYQHRENEYFLDLTDNLPHELYRRFDVVFNHTTLEHIYDVKKAFKNLCDMTKDVVIVIVPFSQVQHETESYKDYWRFPPSCIRKMFEENGLNVIYEAESKARKAAIYLLFVVSRDPKWKERMPKFKPITEAGRSIGFRWSFKELKRKVLRRR